MGQCMCSGLPGVWLNATVFRPAPFHWPADSLPETSLKQLQRAKISALGTYVPPRLLTNADLERMVETNDQWIQERTGIRQRHLVDKGMATSDISCEAARKALARAGVPASALE